MATWNDLFGQILEYYFQPYRDDWHDENSGIPFEISVGFKISVAIVSFYLILRI